jgi:hypothetical protein
MKEKLRFLSLNEPCASFTFQQRSSGDGEAMTKQ